MRLAIVELHKEENEFSAGHFTIFSATDREDLHGHNYSVAVSMQVILNDNGLASDYRIFKKKVRAVCQQLNGRFLLPSQSKFLKLEDTGEMWIAHFNQEKIPFLKRDVVILPIANVTLEELSYWFLGELTKDQVELNQLGIKDVIVRVFNGSSKSGATSCGHR